MNKAEKLQKQQMYSQFPGLIFDNIITEFSVCVECAYKCPQKHVCLSQSDLLRNREIEQLKDWSKLTSNSSLKDTFTQINVDDIVCNICGTIFGNSDTFSEHLKNVHEIDTKKKGELFCTDCGNLFLRRSSLRHHQLALHGNSDKGNNNRINYIYI